MSDLTQWHPITLPSLGRFYGDKCPDGAVEITPWTTAQEEEIIRYSGRVIDRRKLFDKLVEGNTRFPVEMAYRDLTVPDQFYLLMKLRSISLMCQYTVDHICPQCETTHEVSYDLEKLPCNAPDSENPEPVTVKLPRCGRTVDLRILRVYDEEKIAKYADQKMQVYASDQPSDEVKEVYRYRLARQILTIDGETLPFNEKKDFVGSLIMIDIAVIRQALEDAETGMVTDVKARCPKCGFVDEWDLPIQLGFFRPKRADIRAATAEAGHSGEGD